MEEIWAIILAAGESKRMGTQKLLLPWRNKTMVETVADTVLLSDVDHCMVVLGSHGEEIRDPLCHRPVCFCTNENFSNGMLSSVICGIRALPQSAGAFLVFLGDQPFIPADAVNRVIQTALLMKKGIIIPCYKGKRGHPTLFDIKYRETICRLNPAEGLRSLLNEFPDDVIEIETQFPGIIRDIDTKNDYINELNQM